jgi:hypothetical protein
VSLAYELRLLDGSEWIHPRITRRRRRTPRVWQDVLRLLRSDGKAEVHVPGQLALRERTGLMGPNEAVVVSLRILALQIHATSYERRDERRAVAQLQE